MPFFTAQTKKRLPYMTLMNDYFFAYFMRDNPECMQMTLQTICGDNAISVEKVIIQDPLANFGAHGARFDASVWSRSGHRYSMEIENDKNRASELRLRFYAGTQDSHLLSSGEDVLQQTPMSSNKDGQKGFAKKINIRTIIWCSVHRTARSRRTVQRFGGFLLRTPSAEQRQEAQKLPL